MNITRMADCEHGVSFDDSCDRCDVTANRTETGQSPARFNELDMMMAVVEAARWHAKHHRTGKEDGCPVCISLLDLDAAREGK